jgi:hypothetical protein
MDAAVASLISRGSAFDLCVGQLIRRLDTGHVEVREPSGNVVDAHVLQSARTDVLAALEAKGSAMALLCFPKEGGIRAVIVGVVALLPASKLEADPGSDRSKRHDVDSFVIEAGEIIELRCGGSAVTLTKDGKVVIRGHDVTARARRNNKIKGATVQIN